jgi:hypothetical protein
MTGMYQTNLIRELDPNSGISTPVPKPFPMGNGTPTSGNPGDPAPHPFRDLLCAALKSLKYLSIICPKDTLVWIPVP